jgi:hypothetical protein
MGDRPTVKIHNLRVARSRGCGAVAFIERLFVFGPGYNMVKLTEADASTYRPVPKWNVKPRSS